LQSQLGKILHELYCDSGLDLYEKQAALGDDSARLQRALTLAQQRYDAMTVSERVMPPAQAIPCLARVIIQAIGSVGNTLDYDFYESLPRFSL